MFQTLQKSYADKPVRFLLFPCNQFLSQEPHANSVIKAFAEGYISLTQGNFFMFAKTNGNPPACGGTSADCAPSSEKCCPENGNVYDYLRGAKGGKLDWNFDKFITGADGVPQARFGSADVGSDITTAIDAALASMPTNAARAAELRA